MTVDNAFYIPTTWRSDVMVEIITSPHTMYRPSVFFKIHIQLYNLQRAHVKPGPHQQQSRSNNVAYTGNFVACYRVKCYEVACISNNVASTLLLVWTGLLCSKRHIRYVGNERVSISVEATDHFMALLCS